MLDKTFTHLICNCWNKATPYILNSYNSFNPNDPGGSVKFFEFS